MIINKLQKIPLQHCNYRTKKSYKQTKPTPMKTLPILKLQMMKNCILLFLLLLAVSSSAQIVNIPDANFKAKLLSASPNNTVAYGNGGYIKIDTNNDNEIQVSEALVITNLDVSNSNISSLIGIESFTNLNYLTCSSNQLTSINVSQQVNLIFLNCGFNQLTNLDVYGLTNLQNLNCSVNQLTILNLNGISNLHQLQCSQNQLTSINVSQQVNLVTFVCSGNQLTNLNVFGLYNLQQLYCDTNQLTSIDLSGLTNLKELTCTFNQLTSLNVSELSNLFKLYCNNNQLTYLNIKNNSNEAQNPVNNLVFSFNPNLQFVCVDDFQLVNVQNRINQYGYTNCQASTYCTFTPGGTYNTITGTQLFDGNNNGCDVNDAPFPNMKIKINDGTTSGATFTNATGNYTFYTQAGSFTVAPELENPSFFNFSPATAVVTFPDNNNNISTNNFCITANGIHNDVEVVLSPISAARPGFDAYYKLVYKNKGNQTLSGNLALTFDDAHTDFVAANPVGSQTANVLQWSYSNLLPFETRVINVTLHLNSPLDTPALNSGDMLDFAANITPVINDELPADNVFVLHQIVVNSMDPNDIQCLEGSSVLSTEIGKYLHYAVQFENTGTAAAENIVVKDVIDTAKYDMDSLQLLDASAPVYARITGNVVEFIFKNIQLSPATGNPPVGGHGDILFKIKSKNTLVTGNSVEKQAKIYFDYNAPINTNIAQTTFAELSNTVFTKDDSIKVSPNPTHAIITIHGNSSIKSITLFDVQGRILETVLNNNSIDLADKTNGIYFLKITSEKGSKVEKVVKE
jgi:Leucine-rich repeat (LRR) protein